MQPKEKHQKARASNGLKAMVQMTVPPDSIDMIRLHHRLSKAAEDARIAIDHRLASFARVYLTAWTPGASAAERWKFNTQAVRVIKLIRKMDGAARKAARKAKDPDDAYHAQFAELLLSTPQAKDQKLVEQMFSMVIDIEPAREKFEAVRKRHHKEVENLVNQLSAWASLEHIKGFSAWGLGTVIGEAGDVGAYSGPRKLFKRLGLAPKECYPRGEKKTGRMIPRKAHGRIMGIIAKPLLNNQWAAERGPNGEKLTTSEQGQAGNIPAHAIGPYGIVYEQVKIRQLAAGKTKSHADKLARRAMVKALLHDVHRAWHGLELDYVIAEDGVSLRTCDSQNSHDRPASASSQGSRLSLRGFDSLLTNDQAAAAYARVPGDLAYAALTSNIPHKPVYSPGPDDDDS